MNGPEPSPPGRPADPPRRRGVGRGPSEDRLLLEQFLSRHDDAAFALLMRRHGPMVLGICRRLLRDPHDADDAFQAEIWLERAREK